MQENATALYRLNQVVQELGNVGYQFEELLKGLKLYDEYKGHLDIGIYEAALETFTNSIAGLEEQIDNLHTVVSYLKDTIDNGVQDSSKQ